MKSLVETEAQLPEVHHQTHVTSLKVPSWNVLLAAASVIIGECCSGCADDVLAAFQSRRRFCSRFSESQGVFPRGDRICYQNLKLIGWVSRIAVSEDETTHQTTNTYLCITYQVIWSKNSALSCFLVVVFCQSRAGPLDCEFQIPSIAFISPQYAILIHTEPSILWFSFQSWITAATNWNNEMSWLAGGDADRERDGGGNKAWNQQPVCVRPWSRCHPPSICRTDPPHNQSRPFIWCRPNQYTSVCSNTSSAEITGGLVVILLHFLPADEKHTKNTRRAPPDR